MAGSKKVKTYVLDTNILLHDSNCIENLGDNTIVIPIPVFEELDDQKKRKDQIGLTARLISRKIDEYRQLGKTKNQKLKTGVTTSAGGKLIVCSIRSDWSEVPDLEQTRDNKIILTAHWLKKQTKFGTVILLSKDTNVRLKAEACGVESDDYMHDKAIKRLEELYSGIIRINVPVECATEILQNLPREGRIKAEKVQLIIDSNELQPNHCVIFDYNGRTVLAIYKKLAGEFRFVEKPKEINENGNGNGNNSVRPRNTEQAFALRLLLDPDIKLVSLVGKAGTGKTLFALLAGVQQLGRYKKILIWRPMVELDQGVGFLPGTLEEKFAPWTEPIIENLEVILGQKMDSKSITLDMMLRTGQLEMKPFTYAQGSTKHDVFVIIDEDQNTSPENTKMLLERAGQGTKVILTGDPYQVRGRYLDAISNGLSNTVQAMVGQEIAGSIILSKGERSELAELAAKLL